MDELFIVNLLFWVFAILCVIWTVTITVMAYRLKKKMEKVEGD